MIKRSQLASESLAAWTIEALISGERSLARQELPEMDVETFCRAFAQADALAGISLALVGFGLDAYKLEQAARSAGAKCFSHFAIDLHEAAAWRNNRKKHPVIIAYARGTTAGVNTLRHFSGATSRELTLKLLAWAGKQVEFNDIPPHMKLLTELEALVKDDDAFSYEQVRAFLETWTSGSGIGAPRDALPSLGLLHDPLLFDQQNTLIRPRLEQNINMMALLRDRSTGQMEGVRKRLARSLEKSKGSADLKNRLKTYEKLQKLRRSPNTDALRSVALEEALKVFAPPPAPAPDAPDATPAPDEDQDEDVTTPTLNDKKLQRTCAEALLDNREEELEKNANALSEGLRQALDSEDDEGSQGEWSCDIDVEGDPQPFQGRLDRPFVAWVRHFCRAEAWGGLIETNIPELKRALDDFDRPGTLLLNPELLVQKRGEDLGLTRLLTGWDENLRSQTTLVAQWARLKELRTTLLGSLEELTHFPLEWFAGQSAVRSLAEDYLQVCGQLFDSVGKHYGAMAQADTNWARTTLDGLLALDVVQVRVKQLDGRMTSKAVLLPTHPLHLWRYLRLSSILRGLGSELNPADRAAVIQEASAPVQFLSVIYASRLPGSHGLGQVLPVANDLHSLATFENLRNAYNGPDGQESLVYAVERFAAAHRLHLHPLRLVLVNAPQAGALLLRLLKVLEKLLDGRKHREIGKARLRVEVRGTPFQKARLDASLLFDTKEREIIEERVASGRLQLIVDREAKPLADILAGLRQRPAHIVAVFDEAPVTVRRGGAGQQLPMSPFCVRRKVAFHKLWNELRLEPTAGDPPFFEFIELIKHVEGNEGEGTPYAWPDAEELRQSVDSVVSPADNPDAFGAHWFFLADRALPEEGEMRAQRLLRRRDGQRQILLAARDYESIARLMLPVFEVDTPNLLMPVAALQKLMAEGAHLIGAGLLDLVKSQENRVDSKRVIGLMGALLTARDYMGRHPDALLVSTDSQLARTWLRLGIQGERCDLLGVRESLGQIIVECIEVKTTKGRPRSITDGEIASACEQVSATRKAVAEGLGDTSMANAQGHYLSAPRNEMLKEVLVQGCMGRYATKPVRERWAQWLEQLFGAEPKTPELRGCVVDVALGSAEEIDDESVTHEGQTVILRHLNEMDVQRLLDSGDEGPDESPDGGNSTPDSPAPAPKPAPAKARSAPPVSPVADDKSPAEKKKISEPSQAPHTPIVLLGHDTKNHQSVTWTPSIAGNPHLMIAGLPGMGKTTSLINICRHLVSGGVMPIAFSYHEDIDEKLGALFPDLSLSDGGSLGFNPMRTAAGNQHAHIDSAGQLRDIFAAIFPDLGDLQQEILRNAIKTSFENHGWGTASGQTSVPPFRHFVELLRSQERPDARTQTLLARLAELDDYGFFDSKAQAQSLLDANHPQILRVHASKSDAMQRAYASFSLYSIYQDMFRRGQQDRITHAVIFDEAHKAAKLKLLPTMAKECRKYGLALIVASQEARDFDASLLSNIGNFLILRVGDQDAKVLSRKVASSDAQRRAADRLKALPKYEALFATVDQKQATNLILSSGD